MICVVLLLTPVEYERIHLPMTTKQADRIAKNLFGENAFAEAKGGYRNIGIRNGMRWTPLARVGAREPQAWMKAIFLAQKQAIINAR